MTKDYRQQNTRKYVLLTLSHAEKRDIDREEVVKRLRSASFMTLTSIVVCKEVHKDGGFHYHVGVRGEGISRYSGTKNLRLLFPEFEGAQCNVSYHKSWSTICQYIQKQDSKPYCWGTTVSEVEAYVKGRESKRGGPELFRMLKSKASWEEVLSDEAFSTRLLTNYQSVRNVFADLQASKDMPHILRRLKDYVSCNVSSGYTKEMLKEKWPVIEWLVYNLCRLRHLKQPQLLIIGPPDTHKTNLIVALTGFLKVYFMPRRRNDFSEASNNYDLWVLDEWQDAELSSGLLKQVLDGQELLLDRKYGSVFKKTQNVPVILLGNEWPRKLSSVDRKALSSRLTELEFSSKLGFALTSEGLANTLYPLLRTELVREKGESFVLSVEGIAGLLTSDSGRGASVIHLGDGGVIYQGASYPVKGPLLLAGVSCWETGLLLEAPKVRLSLPVQLSRRGRPRKWVLASAAVLKRKVEYHSVILL